MKPQTPAVGISLDKDYGDAKTYRVECDCGSHDHAVTMWIEVNSDTEFQQIEVSFYADTWTPWWEKYYNRFSCVWKLLTTGVVRYEHHMILRKQAAVNLANVILSDVKKLEEAQNAAKPKRRRAPTKSS